MSETAEQFLEQNTEYCSRLQARITPEQCKTNQRRSKELSSCHERIRGGHMLPCRGCEGITGAKKKKSRFEGMIKCSCCRGRKNPSDFRTSKITGRRKVMCWKCDDAAMRRREKKRKPPTPPKISIHSNSQSSINTAAMSQFDLIPYHYFTLYEQDGELFMAGSTEKKPGYYKFFNAGGQLRCGARAFFRNAGINGNATFRMEQAGEGPVFRLWEEENPAT